jgi:hypothetical protein
MTSGFDLKPNFKIGKLILGEKGNALVSLVASIIIGAVVLYMVFYQAGSGTTVNTKILFSAFVIVQIFVSAYLYRRHLKRMEMLGSTASSLGLRMSSQGDVKLISDALLWLGLQPGDKQVTGAKLAEVILKFVERFNEVMLRPIIQGTYKGHAVCLGQRTVTRSSGSNVRSRTIHTYFFLEQGKQLPRISIYPASSREYKALRSERFNKMRYSVRFDGGDWAEEFSSAYGVLSEDVNAARAVWTPGLMELLFKNSEYFKDCRLECILIQENRMQITMRKKLESDDIEPILKLMVVMFKLFGEYDEGF